jgi:signal transduction histidine kinase
MNRMAAFAAQSGAALSVYLLTVMGVPISTTQAIVGGVVGVGILRGISALRFRKLGEIALSWLATPLVSIFISFVSTALFLLATPQETGGISGYSSGYQYRDTQDVLSLVQDAADLVTNQGEMAFENFRRDNSKWSHGDTYVFILDSEGNMILHPDPALQGKNMMGLLDVNRKPVIRGLIDRALSEKKEGWYHYQWPEPKSGVPIWKSSFVKLAIAPSGTKYVVGSGLYNTKMEKEFIVELVDSAVSLIEKEGERAFPAFRDKAGPFIFLDTYILVNDLDGVELVNAGFPQLEGRNLMGERDANGDFVMRKFIEKALDEDGGWVDYLWPKPGQVVPSKKYTYVRKARHGDKTYIVGAGVYLK